ncbi:Uncharacterised protein r2_g1459 [Pycnogonum litorale]
MSESDCSVHLAILTTNDLEEHRACVRFCFRLGQTFTTLQKAYGEDFLSHEQRHMWYQHFESGKNVNRSQIWTTLHVNRSMIALRKCSSCCDLRKWSSECFRKKYASVNVYANFILKVEDNLLLGNSENAF